MYNLDNDDDLEAFAQEVAETVLAEQEQSIPGEVQSSLASPAGQIENKEGNSKKHVNSSVDWFSRTPGLNDPVK